MISKIPLVNTFFKKIGITAAILLIFAAVISSVFRSLTPLATQYKGEVESQLSLLVGHPVTIKSMETGWYWFQPVLKLKEVDIHDGPNDTLRLDKLLVGINIVKSLWQWQIQPGVLVIDDIHFNFLEQDGHWTVDGISTNALGKDALTPERARQILGWISQQEQLIIRRVSAHFHFANGSLIPLSGLNIAIANNRGHYQLKGEASLLQTNNTSFELLGDVYFDPYHLDKTHGSFYFSAFGVLPAQWQQLLPNTSQRLEGGKGDIALWLDLDKGAISAMQAQVKFKRLAWHFLENNNSQLIQSFAANLAWKPNPGGWKFQADHIKLRMGNYKWPENQVAINYDKAQDSYQVYVQAIVLDSIFSQAIPWPKELSRIIEMKPQGILRDTQVVFRSPELSILLGQGPTFDSLGMTSIATRFEQLAWHENRDIPQVNNLSGAFTWRPENGRLELDSEQVTLEAKTYPIQQFSMLNAAIRWQKQSIIDGYNIELERFVLGHKDLTLNAEGHLGEVTPSHIGPVLLSAEFSGTNFQQWIAYLPKSYLKPGLSKWLNTSFKDIKHVTGKIVIDGKAADFPFDNQQGQFEIMAHAEGVDIVFAPKWPLVKNVDTYLHLKSRDLTVDFAHGDFQDIPVEQMQLRIADIGHDKERLFLHTKVQTEAQKILNFVLNSPLKTSLVQLKQLTIKGIANLDLHMEIPLYPEDNKILVKSEMDFKNNKLISKHLSTAIQIDNLTGKVGFTQDEILKSSLKGKTLGLPITISMQSIKQPEPATQVLIAGEYPFAKLPVLPALSIATSSAKQDPVNKSGDLGSGNYPFNVIIDIPKASPMQVHVNYGGKLSTDLQVKAKLLSENKWLITVLKEPLHSELKYDPNSNSLSGHISNLHLEQLPSTTTKLSEPRPLGSRNTLKPENIPNLNLQINNLKVADKQIGNMRLHSKSEKGRWHIEHCEIDSPVYRFSVGGEWTQKDGRDHTYLDINLQLNSLAKTLERWNITPAVDSNRGEMEFHGSWEKGLLDFSLNSVKGKLSLQLKNGIITHLSPETESKLGLGKLLSILSLQTIPRRLMLDFSDLANEGFSFDVYKGNFKIHKGIMSSEDSYLDGPVAHASMQGNLDLVKKNYDLNLHITPHITASLPVVATIAGGPIAGVAALVVNKIINKGMQKISGYSYKINGPWGDPVIEQVKIQHHQITKRQ